MPAYSFRPQFAGPILAGTKGGTFFADIGIQDDPGVGCGEGAFRVQITDRAGRVLYQDDGW